MIDLALKYRKDGCGSMQKLAKKLINSLYGLFDEMLNLQLNVN